MGGDVRCSHHGILSGNISNNALAIKEMDAKVEEKIDKKTFFWFFGILLTVVLSINAVAVTVSGENSKRLDDNIVEIRQDVKGINEQVSKIGSNIQVQRAEISHLGEKIKEMSEK